MSKGNGKLEEKPKTKRRGSKQDKAKGGMLGSNVSRTNMFAVMLPSYGFFNHC